MSPGSPVPGWRALLIGGEGLEVIAAALPRVFTGVSLRSTRNPIPLRKHIKAGLAFDVRGSAGRRQLSRCDLWSHWRGVPGEGLLWPLGLCLPEAWVTGSGWPGPRPLGCALTQCCSGPDSQLGSPTSCRDLGGRGGWWCQGRAGLHPPRGPTAGCGVWVSAWAPHTSKS